MRLSIITSALVAALVGFGSTIALILSAAQAVGATPQQTTSWIVALCLSMAVTTGYLTLRHRLPIITAWSTPGAALIGASSGLSMEMVTGAFLLAGSLIVLAGLFRPVGALIERIPTPVASAMLAGVLVRFVVGLFESAQTNPAFVLPLVGVFLLVRLANPALAVLAALGVGLAVTFGFDMVQPLPAGIELPDLVFVLPAFDFATLVGLGLPLFLVTMASQNLPGFAVLRASGYEAIPTRSILVTTGIASIVTAFAGALTSNLAAISAALCTGRDTHPDPSKRWLTGPFYAATYLLFALFSGALIALLAALPSALVKTVAGLGLIGALSGALASAMADETKRFPAILTFAVTASGFTLLGIGSAFWGLLAGLIAAGLERARIKKG